MFFRRKVRDTEFRHLWQLYFQKNDMICQLCGRLPKATDNYTQYVYTVVFIDELNFSTICFLYKMALFKENNIKSRKNVK